jgi:hypothetical protein
MDALKSMMPFEDMTMNLVLLASIVVALSGAVWYFYLRPKQMMTAEMPEMDMSMPEEFAEMETPEISDENRELLEMKGIPEENMESLVQDGQVLINNA